MATINPTLIELEWIDFWLELVTLFLVKSVIFSPKKIGFYGPVILIFQLTAIIFCTELEQCICFKTVCISTFYANSQLLCKVESNTG